MPMSTGKTGRGVRFEVSAIGSPSGNWAQIANVVSISSSGRDAEEVDFTHLLSEGGFREFRQGFKDPGSISVEYQFDPTNATHVDILDRWNDGGVFQWRINFFTAGWPWAYVGMGFVQNPGDLTVNVNDPISGSATIRVTGETDIIPTAS